MAYAVGHVSGGHFNPAVTLGLAAAKRFAWKDVGAYVATQVVAAIAAAAVLFVIASGRAGFSATESGFATERLRRPLAGRVLPACRPGHRGRADRRSSSTSSSASPTRRAPKGFAPLAIGLSLTLIHLVSIPVTNTSVNPARSIGPALFAGWDAIAQLWLFILAPAAGALLVGFAYRTLLGSRSPAPLETATEG